MHLSSFKLDDFGYIAVSYYDKNKFTSTTQMEVMCINSYQHLYTQSILSFTINGVLLLRYVRA